jgi:hypothetical protein
MDGPKNIPESFVAYTCSFVDPSSGKLMTRVLDSSPFGNEAHTGENIEDKLTETVKTWNIEGM